MNCARDMKNVGFYLSTGFPVNTSISGSEEDENRLENCYEFQHKHSFQFLDFTPELLKPNALHYLC